MAIHSTFQALPASSSISAIELTPKMPTWDFWFKGKVGQINCIKYCCLLKCFTCWCLTCFYPPESANPRIAAKHPFRPPTTCAKSDQKSCVFCCLPNLEGPLSTFGKRRICTKFTGFLAAARNNLYTVNALILMHVYRLYTVFINIPLQNGHSVVKSYCVKCSSQIWNKSFQLLVHCGYQKPPSQFGQNYGQAEMASLICAQWDN